MPHLCEFLKRVLPAQSKRVGGIKQGGPLSSLMLEVYLNYSLDRPLRKAGLPVRVIRYADDVLVCAPDKPAAERADDELRMRLHPTGLRLKSTFVEAVTDLRTGVAEWLGFRFNLVADEFQIHLANTAVGKLTHHLVQAHGRPRPAARALEIVEGWVSQLGPCCLWEDADAVCQRAKKAADDCGFWETPSVGRLKRLWGAAAGRWEQTRQVARRNTHYLVTGPVTAPTPTSVVW